MRRDTWLNRFVAKGGSGLSVEGLEELTKLDDELFAIWNLGDNVLLSWTHGDGDGEFLFLSVRHYTIPESVHAHSAVDGGVRDAQFINELLSGPKYLPPTQFDRVCRVFDSEPNRVRVNLRVDSDGVATVVSDMVRCYGVSLVRDRAVVLLDAVAFSVRSPLDQMAMLNSLAYSVNSAYAQLLSRNIRIDFARTTTGDGFYIWNRSTTSDGNTELYKLLMMLLADNAVAQKKNRSPWVPRLRAAFHVGDHYEFYQVQGLNPTNFSYIVGQVTVDLARMLEHALPGQILLGDFVTSMGSVPHDTLDFVEDAAATLDQLHGLDISGGRIKTIRCYVTGQGVEAGRYLVNRYHLSDKHGTSRAVYNAKINIHRESADPIFLGIQHEALADFKVPVDIRHARAQEVRRR